MGFLIFVIEQSVHIHTAYSILLKMINDNDKLVKYCKVPWTKRTVVINL